MVRKQWKFVSVLLVVMLSSIAILSGCTKSDSGNTNANANSNANTNAAGSNGAGADENAGSADAGSGEKIKLRLTGWGAPDEVAAYKFAIEKFEKAHPNINVEFQAISADYDTKLTTMVAGNDEPDVAMMESATIAYPLAEQGKFVNLQDYLSADTEVTPDALVPNITYSAEPGNVIGIGPGPETFVLYYNEDVFKAAGIEPPPADPAQAWKWDQFVDVAKRLTIDNKGRNATEEGFDPKSIKQFGINLPTWWGVYSNFIYSNGGDFLSADGKTLALNQPEAVEALQKMADLINVYHVAPSPLQSKNIPGTNVALQTKKVAMAFDGQWATASLAQSKFNYNVAPMPVLKQPVTTIVAGMFSIFKSTKHPQESWELLKALIDPDASLDVITAGTWMPSHKDWYTDADKLAKWTQNLPSRPSGYKGAVIDMLLNHSHATPTSYVKNFNKIMDVINPAMDKVWLGKQSAKEALDAVAAKAQEQVQGRRDVK
ncbi:ABC transporter substrate-binding protein [Paenibacillus sacheonensis]|uniref:Extracellular solute-binding protein n=1 Tax=Paenibacillus sacheonensis TaxID=742054 RepID=A0A7X4YU51_9BACL|nr:sugar ABC transporter substrate-binding protein [Paenibacillus sacheonensis]MBM7568850.1 multiple sugar transport system substrate-binding protein [Paenibacillus sacheonensis]NBC72553.1 extracellular solute-binding protein [Paenibacillus sacheonensis]